MEISKLKDQGLLIKTKSGNLAINPLLKDGKIPADAANCDFILSSRPEQEMDKFSKDKRIFSWPGEYEIKGIAVHSKPVAAYGHDSKAPLLFVIYTEEEKCCYLPEIQEPLSSELIENIGDVDVLIFPAVGDEKLWHSTIEAIEPKSMIPLFEDGGKVSVDSFLSKAGLTKPVAQEKIVIKSKSELEGEHMDVFLLA